MEQLSDVNMTNGDRILVIDDDEDILELISFNLTKEGFEVLTATSGDEGLKLARQKNPSLIVLDIMLPGFSGTEVLKQLRYDSEQNYIPIIMLTARGEEVDRVLGFELGADDYVTKPFSVRELILRVRAILARLDSEAQPTAQMRFGRIAVDRVRHEVTVADEPVGLTHTEFNLLSYLMQNKGRVLTRDQLLDKVWGYSYGGTTRTVDTHIQRLRDKLGSERGCIRTVRGVGYKLEA